MRIIAGAFKGRRLTGLERAEGRPTADRVREAWFSILGPALPGADVLDLFAGCGALGLEALSRGARHATFVERDRAALAALRANIAALAVADRASVHRGEALRFVRRLEEDAYDVALADPPYDTDRAVALVEAFRRRPFARILAVEHRAGQRVAGDDTRTYGDIAITLCHHP